MKQCWKNLAVSEMSRWQFRKHYRALRISQILEQATTDHSDTLGQQGAGPYSQGHTQVKSLGSPPEFAGNTRISWDAYFDVNVQDMGTQAAPLTTGAMGQLVVPTCEDGSPAEVLEMVNDEQGGGEHRAAT